MSRPASHDRDNDGNGNGDPNTPTNNHDGDGGGDRLEDYNPPADRFLTAQIWWMASELVRRHPHLRISGVEVDEGDRLIIVHDEQDAMSIQWDLVGGCKFLMRGEVTRISWVEIIAAGGAHDIIKQIEWATGLGLPKSTPPSTPRALAYRVIASVLATAVNDRHDWYAVPAPMVASVEDPSPLCEYFEHFPTAIAARAEYASAAQAGLAAGTALVFFQPFWALMRGLEPVAILDAAGIAHTISGAVPLLPRYENQHRILSLTAATIVGPYLP